MLTIFIFLIPNAKNDKEGKIKRTWENGFQCDNFCNFIVDHFSALI